MRTYLPRAQRDFGGSRVPNFPPAPISVSLHHLRADGQNIGGGPYTPAKRTFLFAGMPFCKADNSMNNYTFGPMAEELVSTVISLPFGPHMNIEQADGITIIAGPNIALTVL